MGLRSRDPCQEAVQVIHGQREDFLFTLLLLTDLQWESGGAGEGVGENSIRKREKKERKSIIYGNNKKYLILGGEGSRLCDKNKDEEIGVTLNSPSVLGSSPGA